MKRTYVTIDGDDIGRRIASYYLADDDAGLSRFSAQLSSAVTSITEMLKSRGFSILFSAADGVTACGEDPVDYSIIFNQLAHYQFSGITYSMGIGSNLREAYVALLAAKSNGKACSFSYSMLTEARM